MSWALGKLWEWFCLPCLTIQQKVFLINKFSSTVSSFSCLWEPVTPLQKTFLKLLPTLRRTLHILNLVILKSLLSQTQIIFSWIYTFNHLQLATSNPWHLKLVFNSQVVFLPCTFQAWLTWNRYYPELKSFSPGYTLSITYNWLSQTPDISSYM